MPSWNDGYLVQDPGIISASRSNAAERILSKESCGCNKAAAREIVFSSDKLRINMITHKDLCNEIYRGG